MIASCSDFLPADNAAETKLAGLHNDMEDKSAK